MCCTTGVSKGPDDTLWVLHRGAKPWDAATFFSGGRAEHITDPTPIRGPIMLQLRQARASGSCLEESCSGGGRSAQQMAGSCSAEALLDRSTMQQRLQRFQHKFSLHLQQIFAFQLILVYDLQETGEVLQSWGDGKLVMPHGLSVDARNDAIWVIDVGRHQVRQSQRIVDVIYKAIRSHMAWEDLF